MSDILHDTNRLEALAAANLLDTAAEEPFDRLTRLVTRLLNVPVSLVSLVDKDRQFFKSAQGLSGAVADARQTPLSHSFCQHVVIGGAPLIVENAETDARVCENLAIPDLGVKAYLGVPLTTSAGHVLGSLCAVDFKPRSWSGEDLKTMTDIAEIVMSEIGLRQEIDRRHLAEEQQSLLIDELHHRVKNTLASVQALIRLSLNASLSMAQFRDSIGVRIASLANTHTLLISKRWNAIAFRDIVASELKPFDGGNRTTIDGPNFDLQAELATSVGMVIHELTTNATKYGALSMSQGRLHIRWTMQDAAASEAKKTVDLTWTETGGPLLHAQNQRTPGFGSSLIERLLERQLEGTADFNFAHEGLIFTTRFTVPTVA